ncbi:MAG TPA: hypothetical protein DCS43_08580, partial [Verrucomicrobia bacterium]|nr:hypothetical protein [Verrucomicrobiota bacterium]
QTSSHYTILTTICAMKLAEHLLLQVKVLHYILLDQFLVRMRSGYKAIFIYVRLTVNCLMVQPR